MAFECPECVKASLKIIVSAEFGPDDNSDEGLFRLLNVRTVDFQV